MIKLQLSKHWLLLGLLAGFGIACGDDSGDGQKTDAGGTGGGGSDAGGTGGGGTGGGGTGGKDAGGFTKQECLMLSTKEVPTLCRECACTADPEATRQCGLDCWALLVCVGEKCGGKVGDLACVASKCAAFTSGAASAMAMIASKVALECVDECAGGAAADGGANDAGQ